MNNAYYFIVMNIQVLLLRKFRIKGEIINIKHQKTYKIKILTVQKFMFVIIIREYIDIDCI